MINSSTTTIRNDTDGEMKPMPVAVAYDPYESFLAKRIFSVLAISSILLSCIAWTARQTLNGGNAAFMSNLRKVTTYSLADMGQAPLFNPEEPDPWKSELFARLDRIREACGPLCSINDAESLEEHTKAKGPYFRILEVPVDCDSIMLNEDIDAEDATVPYPIPDELVPFFGMNGLVDVHMEQQLMETTIHQSKITWTEQYVELLKKRAKSPMEEIASPFHWTYRFRMAVEKKVPVNGKRVLVMGGEDPWIEAILLHLGARHVVTLAPGAGIVSEHPQISTMTVAEMRTLYREGQLEQFDAVMSFSTVEHLGLGRYEDALNPWADIIATARARCMTKKGGFMAIALPTGKDNVLFNKERKYGQVRYPLLGANWIQTNGDEELLNHRDQGLAYHPTFIFHNL